MKYLFFFLSLFFFHYSAFATPTILTVRAKAKDAKFIGSSIGGAKIIIRETITGKILAEGFTTGSTGNTERIMKEPQHRHQAISDDETAAFTATLEPEKPVLLTIEGFAPWAYPQARIKVTTQIWLIPGKHMAGDGIVLEFPGLVVNFNTPQVLESYEEGKEVPLSVNVVMMCGCPLTKGGLWDANEYEVQATIRKGGKEVATVPLSPTDQPNTFSAGFLPAQKTIAAPGNYEVTVYAWHPLSGNSGVATTHFMVK